MLIQFITSNLWYALALWIFLYCLDYALTLVGARLFRRNAGAFVLMDNSYELTPYYQKDIANLRLIMPRFLLMLVITTSLLAFIGYVAPETSLGRTVFEFILGAFVLLEVQVHLCHWRDIFAFAVSLNSDGNAVSVVKD